MRLPVFRLWATVLITIAVLAVSMVLSSILVRRRVLDALTLYDSGASFVGVTLAPDAILLTGVCFPARGAVADSAWVLLRGFPFKIEPVQVVLAGVTAYMPDQQREFSPTTNTAGRTPPVSILDGVLVTGNQESRFSATVEHGDMVFSIGGAWGTAWGIRRSNDSVSVVFRDCSSFPGVGGVPPVLAGNSFCGTAKGWQAGMDAEFAGALTGFNGESVDVDFIIILEQGRPSFEIAMDFQQIGPQVSDFLDRISGGAVTHAEPHGMLRIATMGGDSLGLDFELLFASLELSSPALARDTVRFSCRFTGNGILHIGAGLLRIDRGTLSMGSAGCDYELTGRWGSRRLLSVRVHSDSLSGSDLASSIPDPMLGRLRGLRLSGSLGFDIRLTLDWDYPDSSDVSISVRPERLGVDHSPVTFGRLASRTGETVRMTDSWGNSRVIGLDSVASPCFVHAPDLNPWLEPLLCAAEDGTFRRHRGFSEYHIRNSIRTDMNQGRFARGGSTITMQLVKNLFLSREKTLARKLQEVFLTWRMESHLDKDRILELYANVVELGPDVFGFSEAADYYFGTSMAGLSVRETAFLVSILPGPKLYHRFGVQGFVPDYWNSYLDRLIIAAMNRTGLEAYSAEAGLRETLLFDGRVSGMLAGFSR